VPGRPMWKRRAQSRSGVPPVGLPPGADQYDYVFGAAVPSPRPWREDDPCQPRASMRKPSSKANWAAAKHPKHLILRTCGLYARPSDPRAVNFVKTMLRLGATRPDLRIVDDQHCTPTFVPHFARAILFLLGTGGKPCGAARLGCPSRRDACTTIAHRQAGPLGNLSRHQHGEAHLARVRRRDLSPGRNAGRHSRRSPRPSTGRRRLGRRIACSMRRPIIVSAARRCRIGKRRSGSTLAEWREFENFEV